jgi:hypothetical protein
MEQKGFSTAPEKREAVALTTARNMVDALTYLIGVAARAGLVRIAVKLRIVREDLVATMNGLAAEMKDVSDEGTTQEKRPIRSARRAQ